MSSMVQFFLALTAALSAFFRSRTDTALEILALRQQLAVLKRKHPRPRLNICDRLFWTALRHSRCALALCRGMPLVCPQEDDPVKQRPKQL